MVVQELIEQLVSAQGDEAFSSDWIEKRRTVLLSHPDQIFSGQLKRFDTKKKIGKTFLYLSWEQNFLETEGISAFHRFRPVDRLQTRPKCPTLTTLLPPKRTLPKSIAYSANHRFIVPSKKDAELLYHNFHINEENVSVVHPAVRRYVSFVQDFQTTQEGWILFLVDNTRSIDIKKLIHVISSRFPHVPHKILNLHDPSHFVPSDWVRVLENTKVCFYLTELPFDWPYPALEILYFGVPVLYFDQHNALSELMTQPSLRLSNFLIEQPSFDQIMKATREEWKHLEQSEVFEPFAFAKQYRNVYQTVQ
jgi:hypothetical protein